MGQGAATSMEDLLAEFLSEHKQLKARLKENQQLIEQSQLEVDRMRERNIAITSQLRRVEENFETIPRPDIKVAYDDAMEAKTRLLTMQGQLEKLRGNQEELQYFEQLIGRMVSVVQRLVPQALSPSIGPGMEELGQMGQLDQGNLSTQAIVRIVEAQEDERQRLARQMHDGPAQSLTNFILQAEICQRLFEMDKQRAQEELNNLKTAASSTFQKVRDFIFDLRPMMLDDLGLVPTIRRYIDAFQEKTSIDCQLNILGDERRLQSHIEVMMFRAIQTVMGNARDQFGSKSITIVLDVGPERLKATLELDGRSFDAEAVFSHEGEDTYGFRTLRERIELIGGTLDISSSDEQGNRFVIVLPAYG